MLRPWYASAPVSEAVKHYLQDPADAPQPTSGVLAEIDRWL